MLRLICKQLWNRWRANVWIFIELLLVFCLLWYIVDYFFVVEYNRSIPSCRDLRHTWQVQMAQLPDAHPEYQPGESDSTALLDNFDRVLDRIRQFEGVEAVAVVNEMCLPASGSFWGNEYRNKADTSRTVGGQIISFDPRTDFFKVFRYTTPDGRPVSVKDFDFSDPHAIVLGSLTVESLSPEKGANGLLLEPPGDPNMTFPVRGVVGDIKRFDFERPQMAFYQTELVDLDNFSDMIIVLRSGENISDARFQQNFEEKMSRELRFGNFYLKKIISFTQINADSEADFGVTNNYRTRTAMLLFFLVNIMLCVMGTFWYRIRVRRDEIGLRMAMGSTRAGIRRLLLTEGIVLLILASLPALLIETQFVYLNLIDTPGLNENMTGTYLPDRTIIRFILTNCITWILLSVAILVAVWLPADKASKMAPADALHYE